MKICWMSLHYICIRAEKTDKVTLEGKRRQLEKADKTLVGSLLFDLLEPARGLSLNMQEELVNIIKIVDSIDSTRKRCERLLKNILNDPVTVFNCRECFIKSNK